MSQPHKYRYNTTTALIIIAIVEILFWSIGYATYYYVTEEVPEFRLENEWALYLFVAIPFMLLLFFRIIFWKNKAINRYADKQLLPSLFSGYSTGKPLIKFMLLRLSVSFLIIAMANPQYGENEKDVESKGIDIMLAIDVSNSMLAEDLSPGYSRLKISKLSIEKLIDKLHGDHIGIVVFAGSAYKHLPITPDYHVAKTFTQNVTTRMMSAQGTDIGLAIDECMTSFNFENGANKTIVVFSDGEDHEEQGMIAAEKASELGVVVHTIGMGTTKGVPIPIYKNGKKTGNKKDENENTVLTKLNEENLINIANAGEGSYTRANGMSIGLEGLINQINTIEKSTLSSEKYTGYEDQFQPFLAIGLLLLLIELFMNEKRTKMVDKIKLFEEI